MCDNESKVLDREQWKNEAQAIINDMKCHVRDISISSKLSSDNHCIYLNLTTLEGFEFCVQVSGSGFCATSYDEDMGLTTETETFETPYSLLESISPQFKNSFANELTKKLKELAKKIDRE